MTEENIQTHDGGEVPMPEMNAHNHDHDAPVSVSEDNIARVSVSAEEKELEPYQKQYIQEKRKHVSLKGFRKGKAPETMVARLFKDEARLTARDNVLYNKYIKLLQEHKLQPLSQPKVDHVHDEDGKVAAILVVDVVQPVVLGQYLGLEIETAPTKSVEDGVKKTLAEIKHSYPKLIDVQDGVVESGSVVVADFTVTDRDKELEKQTDFRIRVGAGLYYQPFEQHIIGGTVGQNIEFDVNFPADYHKEDFRDKNIHFNLTVKGIKSMGEYSDDELAKVLGYDGGEKMLELITKEVETKVKDEEHLYYENQILGQLLSAHQFKIPRKLLDTEVAKIRAEQPDMPADRVEEIADRFVRTDLVLHAIYERHPDIQFSQEQFNAKVEELAARANDTVEGTMQKLQAAGKLQAYVNYLSNCKVIDFLIEMADKKEPTVEVKNDDVEIVTSSEVEVTLTKTEEKDNG